MKIGIDGRTLMDKQYSGVSEYTLNLITEILKSDKENKYSLFYNSSGSLDNRTPKLNYPNLEISKKSIPNKILNYILFNFLNAPKVDRMLESDIFFMPHINFIALSGKARSILTIHDLSFLRFSEFFSARKNFWHKMINTKKLVKKIDKIVAVSESTKRDIVELLNVDPEKVTVIYSGVENDFRVIGEGDKKLSEIKNKYSLPEKFILFLGTIEPRKNIEGLINAYSKLRSKNKNLENYKLVIAGGKGWKSETIYKAWEKSRYKNDIKFLGYVEKKDKVYLYNLASLFVYPSFYEGFGFPPLEAMASGVPLITSFSSSLPEIVGDAGLMIDPYNINDIYEAMKQVLLDSELNANLIKKGLEQARKFKWGNTAKEYINLFKDV